MDTAPLGHRIAARRRKVGLSQKKLGEAVGLTISQISRIEGGQRMPPLDTMLRIAAAIGASPAYLLRDLSP